VLDVLISCKDWLGYRYQSELYCDLVE